MAIREGKWDCRSCGRKGNRGPDSYCGSCGSPRPDDIEFYLTDDAEEVTDEKLIKEAQAGADWRCSYCSTQNNAFDQFCVSCGNKRSQEGGDVSLKEREIRFDNLDDQKIPETAEKPGIAKKIIYAISVVLATVLLLFGLSLVKSEIPLKVTGFEYSAKISYEEYKLVKEEDWSLPQGAAKTGEYRAVHHYDKIPDGYETRTRQGQVKVGEKKVKVGVKDLGNGYFKDIYENRPVYETKTETYRETKYRDVPVYMTKYRYNIMKWVKGPPLEFKGNNRNLTFQTHEEELKKSPERFRNINTDSIFYLIVTDDKAKTYRDDVKFKTWSEAEINARLTGEKSSVFGFFYGIKE